MKPHFEPGDEIERKLPNGMAEVFVIEDPSFSRGMGGIPDFYNLKIQRKGSRRATPVTNILNVGTMNGSQIQQGSHGSHQSGSFNLGTDHTALLDVLEKIRTDLPNLSVDGRQEAEVYIDAVEKQVKLAKPNAGFVRSSLEGLWHVVSKVVTMTSVAAFKTWLAAHGIPTS